MQATTAMKQSSPPGALALGPASLAPVEGCCTAAGTLAGSGRVSGAIGGLPATTARDKRHAGSGLLPRLWLLGAWLWLTAVPAFGQTVLLTLDDPTPQAAALFGNVMAGIGDVNGDGVPDLAVGAPSQDVSGHLHQGQVFIFSGANGALLRTLNDPTPQESGHFGTAVAGIGDVNGDRVSEVAVGASGQEVFIFSGANGALLRTLNMAGTAIAFGTALAGVEDINGDGVPELAVGDHVHNVAAVNTGKVFIFSGANGALLRTLDDPRFIGRFAFGAVIQTVADVNDDRVRDLVVGAPGDVGLSNDQGRVFVFSGANGALLRTLDHPVPQHRAQFGRAVAEAGDVNGDGVSDLAVGAPYQLVNSPPEHAGQVFVFSGANGALLRTLDHPGPSFGAIFGIALAKVGDLNSDGVPELAVSDPSKDVGGNHNQGRVFVFSGADGTLLRTLDHPMPQAEALFGLTLTAMGDIDGDGMPDLAIGAPTNGQVFVLSLSMQSQPPPPPAPAPAPSPHIIWRNQRMGEVAVWLLDGTRVLGGDVVRSVSLDWRIVGSGDYNGDGTADILWRNLETGEVAVWLLDGTRVLGGDVVRSVSLDWHIVGSGDHNGNGTGE